MSRVRSYGNKATELAMMAMLRQHHIVGWRRHFPLIGRPDFVFPKERIALFVDGCFWHGCPEHESKPASNAQFWETKLARNKARDQVVRRALRRRGWSVIRVWQHELSRRGHTRAARRLLRAIERRSLHAR